MRPATTIVLAVLLGAILLVAWLYRHEGRASAFSKCALAALRIALVLLAVFMLSEAVLSVGRQGVPSLTILVDDSASEAIVDQYAKPQERDALQALAASSMSAADRPSPGEAAGAASAPEGTTRIAIAKGLILKDKARLLRDARALLAPVQWEEPFGLVLIEALLSGCPVVAFPRGSVPELIESGITGFVVRTVEEMARAIRPGGPVDRLDRRRIREVAVQIEGADHPEQQCQQAGLAHRGQVVAGKHAAQA